MSVRVCSQHPGVPWPHKLGLTAMDCPGPAVKSVEPMELKGRKK